MQCKLCTCVYCKSPLHRTVVRYALLRMRQLRTKNIQIHLNLSRKKNQPKERRQKLVTCSYASKYWLCDHNKYDIHLITSFCRALLLRRVKQLPQRKGKEEEHLKLLNHLPVHIHVQLHVHFPGSVFFFLATLVCIRAYTCNWLKCLFNIFSMPLHLFFGYKTSSAVNS